MSKQIFLLSQKSRWFLNEGHTLNDLLLQYINKLNSLKLKFKNRFLFMKLHFY